MIESINYQLRKISKTRGHFPNDDALIKLLYLGCRDLGSTAPEPPRRTLNGYNWKTALNQFDIMFPGRLDSPDTTTVRHLHRQPDRPSRIASCRSARSASMAANIRRAACRSRLASRPRPDRVPAPVALATSHSSAAATCTAVASTGACSAALHDHPDLLDPQLPGRERLPGRGVVSCNSRANRNPPAACSRVRPGQPRQPRIGPGLRGRLGHPPPVGLGRQRQPQRRGPRLHPSQPRDRLAQRVVAQRLHRYPTGPRQTRLDIGDQLTHAVLGHRRIRGPIKHSNTHTCMV